MKEQAQEYFDRESYASELELLKPLEYGQRREKATNERDRLVVT